MPEYAQEFSLTHSNNLRLISKAPENHPTALKPSPTFSIFSEKNSQDGLTKDLYYSLDLHFITDMSPCYVVYFFK